LGTHHAQEIGKLTTSPTKKETDMAHAQSNDDLAYLIAKDDLSDAEFSRLLAYVPTDKIAAVFERVAQVLADITAIDGLNAAQQFGR
jgi:hypothetical protein